MTDKLKLGALLIDALGSLLMAVDEVSQEGIYNFSLRCIKTIGGDQSEEIISEYV